MTGIRETYDDMIEEQPSRIAELEAGNAQLLEMAKAAQALLNVLYRLERNEANEDDYYRCEGTLQGLLDAALPGEPEPDNLAQCMAIAEQFMANLAQEVSDDA